MTEEKVRAGDTRAVAGSPSAAFSELIRLGVLHTGFDLSLQDRLELLQPLGLVLTEVPKGNTFILGRKVRQVRDGGGNVGALRALLAREAREHRLSQPCARIGHGERRAALPVLGVDDVSAGVLHVLVKVGDLLRLDGLGHLVLGEERQDGLACMTTNNGHIDEVGVLA
eukprot:CAMPEP_0171237518 /NCGR_PEP_ID=MMETSP0790-20130122/43006_1 /TAXON_ID=2925 /ORGANISM="Alexandrium catenella, Strain OF101" /LENGTH=168 /DNA_ID=CAMNT_0011703869 /DNA_START=20 /DNA_END=523 /DNA_ORIENTATION=+